MTGIIPLNPKFIRFALPFLVVACMLTINYPSLADKDFAPCPFKSPHDAVDACLKRRADNEWKKIKWQTNAAVALRQAQRENKPIFVFVMVNQQRSLSERKSGDT